MVASEPAAIDDLSPLRAALMRAGAQGQDDYVWRQRRDLYTITLAEILLRRTTRTVVKRVLPVLLSRYPTPLALVRGRADAVWQVIRPTGLRSRVNTLRDAARALVEAGSDFRPDALLEIRGVGQYIRDAVALYVYDEPVLPLDSTAQRTLRRAALGARTGRRPPLKEPYRDTDLQRVVQALTSGEPARSVRLLHQGVLDVGWGYCRSRPLCTGCPLKGACSFQVTSEESA